MRLWGSAVICSLMFLSGQVGVAQEARGRGAAEQVINETIADKVVKGYRFETHLIDSKDQQRHYRIYLAIPDKLAPAQGFDSLYMLDGNAAMATLTVAQLEKLASLPNTPVLVAVGYNINTRNDVVARSYDYTPPVYAENQLIHNPVVRGRVGGGAAVFLDFFNSDIIPLVAKQAPLNLQKMSLWGHSYGGLFTLYAASQPRSPFISYIAADPSLWWHDYALPEQWQSLQTTELPIRRLTLQIGTKPRTPKQNNPNVAARPASINNGLVLYVLRLQQALWPISYETFPQHGHGDMIATSIAKALHLFEIEAKEQ